MACGVLAAAILLFVPGLLDPFDPAKAMVLRVVGVPALVGALVAWIGAGVWHSPQRRLKAAEPRAAALVDLAVAGWALVSLLSTVLGASPRLSLQGEFQQREGLLTTLGLLGVYATIRRSHLRAAHVRSTVNVLLAGAAIAAAYALLQFLGHDPLRWNEAARYPSGAGTVLRPFATLGNPILLGAILAPALGIVAARVATGSEPIAWWGTLGALLGVVALTTLSRGAWLSSLGSVTTAIAGAALFRLARFRRAVVPGAVALAAASLAAWALRAPLASRVSEGLGAGGESAVLRREIARAALALWRGHPWLGTGPDTFGLLFPRVQGLAYGGGLWNGLPGNAHSVALQVLATTGTLGALCGLSWLGGLAWTVWTTPAEAAERREKLELAAAAVALALFAAFNEVGIAGAVVFVALTAMLIRRDEHTDAVDRGPRVGAARLLQVVLTVALGLRAIPELEALAATGRARNALQQAVGVSGEARRALVGRAAAEATDGARHAPAEDEPWRLACDADLALAREALRTNELPVAASVARRAEASARRAVALEPLRARNVQCLANALALRARIALRVSRPPMEIAALERGCDSAFAAARALAPQDATILIDEARAELELGRAPEARETAQRMVSLYPQAATGYSLMAAAQLMMGERRQAASSLRIALTRRWMDDQGAEERTARAYLRTLEASDSRR